MIQIADVFAVSTTDEERYESDVTDHPAESGSNFVDNKITKPLVITRDCIISATPLGENLNATFGPDIVEGCRARLIAIDATREPITVIDSTGTYPNMEITSLAFSRTVKTGDALVFKISFKRLTVITNERSVIQVAIPRAQSVVKRGTKSSKAPPEPPPPPDKRTALHQTRDYIARTFFGGK